jgi:hypothetical protein
MCATCSAQLIVIDIVLIIYNLSLNFTTKVCKNLQGHHVCYMLSPAHRR